MHFLLFPFQGDGPVITCHFASFGCSLHFNCETLIEESTNSNPKVRILDKGRLARDQIHACFLVQGDVLGAGHPTDSNQSKMAKFWRDRKSTRLNSSHLGISYA